MRQSAFIFAIDIIKQWLIIYSQQHVPMITEEKDLRPFEPIPLEYLKAFKDMWADPGIQKTVERGNEFALHDNLG